MPRKHNIYDKSTRYSNIYKSDSKHSFGTTIEPGDTVLETRRHITPPPTPTPTPPPTPPREIQPNFPPEQQPPPHEIQPDERIEQQPSDPILPPRPSPRVLSDEPLRRRPNLPWTIRKMGLHHRETEFAPKREAQLEVARKKKRKDYVGGLKRAHGKKYWKNHDDGKFL